MLGVTHEVQHRASIRKPSRLLIVGREGVKELGEFFRSFLSSRGNNVDCLMDFDQVNMVGLCRVSIDGPNTPALHSADPDLVVGLDGSMFGYDERLALNGSILLDTSTAAERPKRDDAATITVPAQTLAERAMAASSGKPDVFDCRGLVGAVMFGATLAVAEQYPERCELEWLFGRFYPEQFLPLVLSTYEGYDWVQDRLMRGKSLAMIEKS